LSTSAALLDEALAFDEALVLDELEASVALELLALSEADELAALEELLADELVLLEPPHAHNPRQHAIMNASTTAIFDFFIGFIPFNDIELMSMAFSHRSLLYHPLPCLCAARYSSHGCEVRCQPLQ